MDLQELLEDRNDAGMAIRALIQEAPITILRIAIAVSEGRGRWPAESVTRAAAEEINLILELPAVEARIELERCLLGRDIDQALEWLHAVGAVNLLLPELEACVNLAQEAGRLHKDVWDHTKQVVKQSVRRPSVRWAALLHDIGKVPTRTFTKNGVHFHGHAEVGARMFDKIARRLPFEHDDRKKIRFLIKHHLRSNQYGEKWTDNAVRRFAREMDPHLVDLLDLSRADITSKRPGRRQLLLQRISELSDRVDRLREEDARLPPLPPGLGNTIMSHFALQPSRLIGDIKRAMESAIERGELEPRRDDAYYIAWIEASGLVTGGGPDPGSGSGKPS